MKYKKILYLLLMLFLMPVIALAKDYSNLSNGILFGQIFITAHVCAFVFYPLSTLIYDKYKKYDIKTIILFLLILRVIVLFIFDLLFPERIEEAIMIDFVSCFIFPIFMSMTGKTIKNNNVALNTKVCPSCGSNIDISSTICPMCNYNLNASTMPIKQNVAKISDYDNLYSVGYDVAFDAFLDRYYKQANLDIKTKLIPKDMLIKKLVINIIFSILVFIYVCLIFFHFPLITYVVGAIILIVFKHNNKSFNLNEYIKKEVISRPEEKVLNIVMSIKNNLVVDSSSKKMVCYLAVALFLPLAIFYKPHILYEKTSTGYGVRFYTFGVSNFKTAEIPSTYNREKVVSLRGNTFSNMPFLYKVTLPDTIVEIRGQAFKNDKNLKYVNIPNKLEYLGGGAFYNCKSITEVTLPNTLNYMGGETFYGASSLRKITLSNSLTEIRGDTFEYCTSLASISIPDNVTRIGGHAFYGDSSLSEVYISKNSKLQEIGSSAFRKCTSLYSITIPKSTYVNMRAFKESPTIVQYYE